MDKDFELTKVTESERKDSKGYDDYFYSSDYTRLIKCPPFPEFEDNGVFCTYDFTQVQVICDNACDIDTCGLFSDGLIMVELPEGITHLGSHVFKGRDLSWVELPKSLKYIGKDPFALTSLFNLQTKNDNFTKDKNGNLCDLANMRLIHNTKSEGKVEIPSNILIIDEYAFSRKNGEPHVKSYYKSFPEKIEKESLTIVIPSSVTSIGDYAFENCNVRTVTFMGRPNKIGTDIFKGCFLLDKINVPSGAKNFFSRLFPDYSTIIDDTGDSVKSQLFKNFMGSNGVSDFMEISCNWHSSVYGYVKDGFFYIADENGAMLDRHEVGLTDDILVFEIIDEHYTSFTPKDVCEGRVIIVNRDNKVSWFEKGEDFYYRISENCLLIHKSLEVDTLYNFEIQKTARFFGDNSEYKVEVICDDWYYYKNDNGINIIHDGKVYIGIYSDIKYFRYKYPFKEQVVILIEHHNKWGMITIEGKHIRPKYKSIKRLDSSDLFKVETFDNQSGIITFYGDEIIDASYELMETTLFPSNKNSLFVLTEDSIFTITWKFFALDKKHTKFALYSENIAELSKAKVKNWFIQNYHRYRFGRLESRDIIELYLDDGKVLYFDNFCSKTSWYNIEDGWYVGKQTKIR